MTKSLHPNQKQFLDYSLTIGIFMSVKKKEKQIEGNKTVFFHSFLCHLFITSTRSMLCCAPNWWAHAAQIKFIQFNFFFWCCFSYSMFYGFLFLFFVVSFSSYVIRCSKLTIKYHFTLIFCPVRRLSLLTICFYSLQIAIENYVALWICIAHNINWTPSSTCFVRIAIDEKLATIF